MDVILNATLIVAGISLMVLVGSYVMWRLERVIDTDFNYD